MNLKNSYNEPMGIDIGIDHPEQGSVPIVTIAFILGISLNHALEIAYPSQTEKMRSGHISQKRLDLFLGRYRCELEDRRG